jgi:hypothetical protein
MKSRNFSAIGGWHSLMFCVGMYFVALFFSIFVCSSVFYALNVKSGNGKAVVMEKAVSGNSGKQVLAAVTH